MGNGLQTNGLLIDRHWAQFLKTHNFLIGLSIDGPEEIHNRYLLNGSGKGSWSRVTQSTKLLLDTDVVVNALTVINDYSVSFPEEIYKFHKDIGLRFMQFIPCIEPDPSDPSCTAPFSLPPEDYVKFLCSIFALWLADFKDCQPTTSIRHFASLLHYYMALDAPECILRQTCGDYLVIEHNGDVYSCDFFLEPICRLGNVADEKLIDMLNSPVNRISAYEKKYLKMSVEVVTGLIIVTAAVTLVLDHNQGRQNKMYFYEKEVPARSASAVAILVTFSGP